LARGILAALAPLGREAGIHAVRLERGPKGECEGTLLASSASSPDPFEAWLREALLRAGGCEVLRATPHRVGLLSRGVAAATRSKARAVCALLRSTGAADMLVIRADDVRGDAASSALVIAAPLRSAGAIPARTLRQLDHFAEHLSSGLRLRRCLSTTGVADDPGAVPAPGEGLAEAVEHEARRSGRPAAPHETEALWEGLANGRWSVIAHLRRPDSFVLLLRQAAKHDPRALTPREREVLAGVARGLSNKEIGYELKIGSTTVATLLRTAAGKMGHLRRPALIATLGASAR
jgi:DNA-binding CsgD family transcriptional regulator